MNLKSSGFTVPYTVIYKRDDFVKGSLCNTIIERFCFENFYFENVRIENKNGLFNTIKRDFDLIVFNQKKIIFFATLENKISRSDAVLKLRGALNSIVNKLSLSLNDFVVCGANNDSYFFLNKHNDNLVMFSRESDYENKIIEYIENEFCYGKECFNYDSIRALSDILTLSVSPTIKNSVQKVKTTADGSTFLYKHGMWREASELNTEVLYPLTALGGMLGLHLFYQKKRSRGIAYLLTLGIFGIGWFFDSLELLFGCYKDEDGKYLLPLQNKVSGLVMLVLGFVVFVLIMLLIVFFNKFVFRGF